MTIPRTYANNFVPIKNFLSSHRALMDGRGGIRQIEALFVQNEYLFSEWKILWIGTCTALRSAMDLFKLDARSCISSDIRSELKKEWKKIENDREAHDIFWKFLREERNNIIHEYKWSAYQAWMEPDGAITSPESILSLMLGRKEGRSLLIMRDGAYKGADSLTLLKEAADWVEQRIFSAIRQAGFDPDERRGVFDFREMPERLVPEGSLLAHFVPENNGLE